MTGVRDGPIRWGTALQAGVRITIVSLEYVIDTLRLHCGPWVVSAPNRTEYQEFFLVVKVAGA